MQSVGGAGVPDNYTGPPDRKKRGPQDDKSGGRETQSTATTWTLVFFFFISLVRKSRDSPREPVIQ